ncbi:hypothetical protein JZX86_05970 [Agrobacterium rosae]|uniref:phage tail assembly chaperone n=1 Tax=Agrobacterium rosae TaxID=1972867 RepID=UPI0019D3C9AC|nr:hypothetical protein [Agrobacterium rosae]MBN7804911.1 hypothetical protein [Agrobacterium rosae]
MPSGPGKGKGKKKSKIILSRREFNERFGRDDENPDQPEISDEGQHLWAWFWHLHARRLQGMNGPQPITYADIDIWSRMTGEAVLREEVAILIRMDDGYRIALAEEMEVHRKAREAG